MKSISQVILAIRAEANYLIAKEKRMLRHGVQLLEGLAQDDRVQICRPSRNLQIKFVRPLPNGSDFVAYIDAIGKLDGNRCLLEWKTTTSRYPEEPHGLLALDPQLVCYSWMSGISDVALVAFVRKRFSEIQYLKTTITDQQREEFGRMVEATASHIEAGEFLPHSGIRFPQNGLEVHHITQRSQLGPDAEENLLTLCWECHRHIHSKLSAAF